MNHHTVSARLNFCVMDTLLRQFLQEFIYIHVAPLVIYVFLDESFVGTLEILQKLT